jgi:RNase H-fold protein (predicted Holliday junction resolvase)
MKILGLDLSCSTCGYAITENKIILFAGFVDISKATTYDDKVALIITALKDQKFDKIIIEESLSGFAFGRTSQQILLKLTKNKAVIAYILEKYYKMNVASINAMTARKTALGAARVKGIKPKDYVKARIEQMYDMKAWTILNKKGHEEKRMEDVRDAIVLSLAG